MHQRIPSLVVLMLLGRAAPAAAAEVLRLGAPNWHLVPGGKEVDAIYGDFLLRNDRVVAVVGDVTPDRAAHLHALSAQGAVLDFTLRATSNDQLTAYYPHGRPDPRADPRVGYPPPQTPSATEAQILIARGRRAVLRLRRPATADDPVEAVTEYALRDGDTFLEVRTRYRNTGPRPASPRLADHVRCDRTFTQTPAGEEPIVFFYDRWFEAAYALVRPGGRLRTDGTGGDSNRGTWVDFPGLPSTLAPGQEVSLTRYLVAGRDAAEVQLVGQRILGLRPPRLALAVADEQRRPVAEAEVTVRRDGGTVSAGRTDARGRVTFGLPPGRYQVLVAQTGRPREEATVELSRSRALAITVGPRSQVAVRVRDADGQPIPAKVQFIGVDGTPDPDLGPFQRAEGCKNLYFTAHGEFSTGLPAGRYRVIVSRGPEYDAVTRELALEPGETGRVEGTLARVVTSRGWISADFHNHTSESGDNTTSPEGRIIALAAEGIDFAASTEHNRVQSYRPRLRKLGLERHLATSDGIELSGRPGEILHMNAFPLSMHAHRQDGGRPPTAADPLAQIRGLAAHDGGRAKLVQQNHPNIGWLFFDRDGDGIRDAGFGTEAFTSVMEVWGGDILAPGPGGSRLFRWLQLLNQGIRIPGVSNTDAHHLFHDSGRVRNFVRSSVDDPALIDEDEVVREARQGHIVMSNGPFLEVSFEGALPGDTVSVTGPGVLRVRVECPNWLDVDRVQVLVNGAPDPALNFTRKTHPRAFGDGVVRFAREIPVTLRRDAHLIVVAVGEGFSTAPVMGPRGTRPLAISNPIHVDVDGGGVAASGDTLGSPLPMKAGPPAAED